MCFPTLLCGFFRRHFPWNFVSPSPVAVESADVYFAKNSYCLTLANMPVTMRVGDSAMGPVFRA
jgi:hypothetical protein